MADDKRDDAPEASRAKRRKRGPAAWILRVVLGLVVGLALAELAFWIRDDGAFPHLNVYQADAELGVRLMPGSSQRLRFGPNPVTDIRINARGYRGAALPPADQPAVVVVGDSQVFGLGVQEGETFSAKLALKTGKRVINAGVPTYGPPEMLRVLEELLAGRKVEAVVYTVNLVNDAFEAARPNRERHAVWDGWAVRKETAPHEVTSFPGRGLLFRRSHAFFALRRLMYERGPRLEDADFRSEGTWEDLVNFAGATASAQERAEADTRALADMYEVESMYASASALAAELRVKKLAFDALELNDTERGAVYLTSHGIPGDIVAAEELAEYSRPLAASAKYVREAAVIRKEIEKELRDKAAAEVDEAMKRSVDEALSERDALEEKLAHALAAPITFVRATSPLQGAIEAAKAKAEAGGARFVLLVLPMDVQVSAEEWKKYPSAKPVDMAPTRIITQHLVDAGKEIGVSVVDATPVLAAAEPGAFLSGDIHMTPKGHEAVADALAKALEQPPPARGPGRILGLPLGRSRVPRPWMWDRTGEITVWGSSAAGCRTQRIREWLRVSCGTRTVGGKSSTPLGIAVERGDRGEAMTMVWDGEMTLIAPIVRGDEFSALLFWSDVVRQLIVHWPADWAEPDMNLDPVKEDAPPPPPIPAVAERLCACHKEVTGQSGCAGLLAAPDADCARTYADDCAALLRCAEGHPIYHPSCAASQVNAGAALHCFNPDDAPKPAEAEAGRAEPVVSSDARDAPPELAAVARPVIDAATKVVARCTLADPVGAIWWDSSSKPQVYDRCKLDDAETAAFEAAARALAAEVQARKAGGSAARLAHQAGLFAAWLGLARRSSITRGTLQGYQALAAAYNDYDPESKVPVDPQPLVDAYFGKAYDPDKRNRWAEGDFSYIYEARRKRGTPLPWGRCINGPCLPSQ